MQALNRLGPWSWSSADLQNGLNRKIGNAKVASEQMSSPTNHLEVAEGEGGGSMERRRVPRKALRRQPAMAEIEEIERRACNSCFQVCMTGLHVSHKRLTRRWTKTPGISSARSSATAAVHGHESSKRHLDNTAATITRLSDKAGCANLGADNSPFRRAG